MLINSYSLRLDINSSEDTEDSPLEVNKFLKDQKCFTPGEPDMNVPAALKKLGLKFKCAQSGARFGNFNKETIDQCLDSGNFVLAGVWHPKKKGQYKEVPSNVDLNGSRSVRHWVLITGRSEDLYTIADPDGAVASHLTWVNVADAKTKIITKQILVGTHNNKIPAKHLQQVINCAAEKNDDLDKFLKELKIDIRKSNGISYYAVNRIYPITNFNSVEPPELIKPKDEKNKNSVSVAKKM